MVAVTRLMTPAGPRVVGGGGTTSFLLVKSLQATAGTVLPCSRLREPETRRGTSDTKEEGGLMFSTDCEVYLCCRSCE